MTRLPQQYFASGPLLAMTGANAAAAEHVHMLQPAPPAAAASSSSSADSDGEAEQHGAITPPPRVLAQSASQGFGGPSFDSTGGGGHGGDAAPPLLLEEEEEGDTSARDATRGGRVAAKTEALSSDDSSPHQPVLRASGSTESVTTPLASPATASVAGGASAGFVPTVKNKDPRAATPPLQLEQLQLLQQQQQQGRSAALPTTESARQHGHHPPRRPLRRFGSSNTTADSEVGEGYDDLDPTARTVRLGGDDNLADVDNALAVGMGLQSARRLSGNNAAAAAAATAAAAVTSGGGAAVAAPFTGAAHPETTLVSTGRSLSGSSVHNRPRAPSLRKFYNAVSGGGQSSQSSSRVTSINVSQGLTPVLAGHSGPPFPFLHSDSAGSGAGQYQSRTPWQFTLQLVRSDIDRSLIPPSRTYCETHPGMFEVISSYIS